MTWMDSYYRVHALTLSWVRSDDDMADWVDEVIGPLDEPPQSWAHAVGNFSTHGPYICFFASGCQPLYLSMGVPGDRS